MEASLVKEGTFNLTVHTSCWDANKGPHALSEIMTQATQIWVLGDWVFNYFSRLQVRLLKSLFHCLLFSLSRVFIS